MSHIAAVAPRWIVAGAVVCLALSAAPRLRGAPARNAQAMTPMTDAVKAELAPNGRLRAALNYSNFLLVSARTPEHAGVAPDLARELARRAGATVEFVGYDNAGLAADAVITHAWDVAFIGAEPARASEITFTPAYVEIEATYLLPGNAAIWSADDLDRDGYTIVTTARAAYTLYLQRTLKHAKLIEAPTMAAALELFKRSNADALAGLKPRLDEDAKGIPTSRVLKGGFTAVQQAMGVPKAHTAAAAYLTAFAAEIRTSGLLASLIATHHADGLTIATP